MSVSLSIREFVRAAAPSPTTSTRFFFWYIRFPPTLLGFEKIPLLLAPHLLQRSHLELRSWPANHPTPTWLTLLLRRRRRSSRPASTASPPFSATAAGSSSTTSSATSSRSPPSTSPPSSPSARAPTASSGNFFYDRLSSPPPLLCLPLTFLFFFLFS